MVLAEAAAPLHRAVAGAVQVVESVQRAMETTGLPEALACGLQELMAEALSRAVQPSSVGRRTRSAIRLAGAAEELMRAHHSRPVYSRSSARHSPCPPASSTTPSSRSVA